MKISSFIVILFIEILVVQTTELFSTSCSNNNGQQDSTFLPHPNCTKFYTCLFDEAVEQNCAFPLHWNKIENWCDWPDRANCIENEAPLQRPPTPPPTPSLSPPTPFPTEGPPKEVGCPLDDDMQNPTLLPHPDCTMFYKCYLGQAIEQYCPPPLHWNNEQNWCDWPNIANCTENAVPPVPTIRPPTPSPKPPQPPSSEGCPLDDDIQNPTLLPHPDCTKFYKCYLGEAVEQNCPPPLQWNVAANWCDWPGIANCTENEAPPQPTLRPPTPPTSTTTRPPSNGSCPLDDDMFNPTLLPHPDCTKFYKCFLGEAVEQNCPPPLHWNVAANWCDWPEVANCEENEAPPQPTLRPPTPSPTATPRPPNNGSCPLDDDQQNPTLLPHPNCTKFYKCFLGEAVEQNCPPPLHWNVAANWCDWPNLANCTENEAPPQPTLRPPTPSTPTPTSTSTTSSPPNNGSCPLDDDEFNPTLLPHPDCTKFYKCYLGVAIEQYCPPPLHWNAAENWCDWPVLANCTENEAPIQPTPTMPPTTPPTAPPTPTVPPTQTSPPPSITDSPPTSPLPSTTDLPPTSPSPSTTDLPPTSPPPSTIPPPSSCPLDGDIHNPTHLPHPDCTKFYICDFGVAIEMNCPPPLHWSISANVCDWPHTANCTDGAAPPQ